MLFGIAVGALGSVGLRLAVETPGSPSIRLAARRAVRVATSDKLVLALSIAVTSAAVYTIALAFFTPVNEGDSHAYHLARVAFWNQAGHIGYVPGAVDLRVDVSPPNAELGQLSTVLLSRSDRYVALPQLLAYGFLVLCVAGLARRIGLSAREAVFGALVFASLPVVVVQASGALNDLVVASFLATSAYFGIEAARGSTLRLGPLVLASLALGLAVGTKLTALLALPAIAILILVAGPRRKGPALIVAGIVAMALGSTWYVINVHETSKLDGGLSEAADQRVDLSVAAVTVNGLRLALDFIDLSGSPRPYAWIFAAAAAALVALGAARLRRSRRDGSALLVAAALTAFPLTLPTLTGLGQRVVLKTWVVSGRPATAAFERGWDVNTIADPVDSWFGPLGAFLLVAGTIVVGAHWRSGSLDATALALALAPWTLLATFAATVVWDPWRGRFFVFGVALAAATWGLWLRWRSTALGITTVAIVVLGLCLATYQGKPSGIGQALGAWNPYGVSVTSIWQTSRPDAQVFVRGDEGLRAVLRFVESRVPADASVALAPQENDFISPYFGRHFSRTVALLTPRERVPAGADWLVLSPRSEVLRCSKAWRSAVEHPSGWSVQRRIGPDTCQAPT